MEGLKTADDLISEQQGQLEEMEDTLKENTPNSDRKSERKHSKGRKRSNSKAKKIAKFEKWMENEVELPEYIELFHEQGLSRLDKVRGLQECDLEELGIEDKSHRLLIIEKIVEMRSRKQSVVRTVPLSETQPLAETQEANEHDEGQSDE